MFGPRSRGGDIHCCSRAAMGEGGGAFVVAGVGLPEGPFGRDGAGEALDFDVLPGAVRPRE